MAYPSSYCRLVASGPLYTVESFSFGLSIVPTSNSATMLDTEALVDDVAAVVSTYWSTAAISNRAQLQIVKFNEIAPTGEYASNDATVFHEFTPVIPGSQSGTTPPQIAIAISLTTARTRGLAHAGRYYLPVPSGALNSAGVLSDSETMAYATDAVNFIQALNDLFPPEWNVGIASDVRGGAFERVTGVRVGKVYDTIRSRRRSLPENYQVALEAVG